MILFGLQNKTKETLSSVNGIGVVPSLPIPSINSICYYIKIDIGTYTHMKQKLKDRYKIRVFDFIMTLNTWYFVYELIRMELFGKYSKNFNRKIEEWNEENR